MTDYQKLRLQDEQMINNPATRLPVCLCIDSSLSMEDHGRIKAINRGLNKFISDIKEDIYAVDSVELCLISFGGTHAEKIIDFSPISSVGTIKLIAQGITPLGGATKMAIEAIENRLGEYEDSGIQNYKPWLILISDGVSTDQYLMYSEKIKKMEYNGELKVLCIGLGDKANNLSEYTVSGKVAKLSDLKMADFFSWLSKSMSKQSLSTTGSEEQIPTDSWEDYLI